MWHTLTELLILMLPLLTSLSYFRELMRHSLTELLILMLPLLTSLFYFRELMWHTLTELLILMLPLLTSLSAHLRQLIPWRPTSRRSDPAVSSGGRLLCGICQEAAIVPAAAPCGHRTYCHYCVHSAAGGLEAKLTHCCDICNVDFNIDSLMYLGL